MPDDFSSPVDVRTLQGQVVSLLMAPEFEFANEHQNGADCRNRHSPALSTPKTQIRPQEDLVIERLRACMGGYYRPVV
ncbi:hypothetical protein MRX96_032766 [Rhipicephalus microplus]